MVTKFHSCPVLNSHFWKDSERSCMVLVFEPMSVVYKAIALPTVLSLRPTYIQKFYERTLPNYTHCHIHGTNL